MLPTQISTSISLCIVRLFSTHIQLPLSAFVTINDEAESAIVKAHRKAEAAMDLGFIQGFRSNPCDLPRYQTLTEMLPKEFSVSLGTTGGP